MIFKTFRTELSRSLKLSLVLILSSALFGLAAFSSLFLKNHIEELFSPTAWNADLIILPKGVSLEDLRRSLKSGEPPSLIPRALLQTLRGQIKDEQERKNLAHAPLRVLGFLPYTADGTAKLALDGTASEFFEAEPSVWTPLPSYDFRMVENEIPSTESYKTTEWGRDVLLGVLVRGEPEALVRLKQLIDRRTVAQAYLLNQQDASVALRLDDLKDGLGALTALIFICLLPGFILALLILRERRQKILLVFRELGFSANTGARLWGVQVLLLILLPCLCGIFIGFCLPLERLIF